MTARDEADPIAALLARAEQLAAEDASGGLTPTLPPLLRAAIEAGVMSRGQAQDVDAFADGLLARMCAGELTEEQVNELAAATAVRDGEAVNRARARAGGNRAARRAEAAQRRRAPR